MAFELVIIRKPASVNRRRDSQYYGVFRAALNQEAAAEFGAAQPLSGALYARIIWFHAGRQGDVDNIIKPILDGLKGVCYTDDRSIVKCAVERVDFSTATIALSSETVPATEYLDILNAIGGPDPHVLYIEIGQLPTRELYFGAVR